MDFLVDGEEGEEGMESGGNGEGGVAERVGIMVGRLAWQLRFGGRGGRSRIYEEHRNGEEEEESGVAKHTEPKTEVKSEDDLRMSDCSKQHFTSFHLSCYLIKHY